MDSSSDDSHRWSDTLSIDEKDGFVFVNYSEGQTKGPHLHHLANSSMPQPLHPCTLEAKTYNQLRTGWCAVISPTTTTPHLTSQNDKCTGSYVVPF